MRQLILVRGFSKKPGAVGLFRCPDCPAAGDDVGNAFLLLSYGTSYIKDNTCFNSKKLMTPYFTLISTL